MGNSFDPLGDAKSVLDIFTKTTKATRAATRIFDAERARREVEDELGTEVAEAVVAAIKSGRNPNAIIERARKEKAAREERERLVREPPDIYGAARWARPDDIAGLLKGREAFDNPRSILLGSMEPDELGNQPGFIHWDGDGHLMTAAYSRQGKAITTIVPNLLRYRGSAIVLDPKGELYEMTSKWRAENVGPVYRLAPFCDRKGDRASWASHGFNPLTQVKLQSDARDLAAQLFPRDPNSSDFFMDDALSIVTATIRYVQEEAPAHRRTLAEVRKLLSLAPHDFIAFVSEGLATSRLEAVREAAHAVMGKHPARSLPTLRDTLNAKLALWGDEELAASLRRDDVDFESLKDSPATVYVEMPFHLMQSYSPWVRVVFLSALKAMLSNRTVPEIPVLFLLDEFLQLGPFAEMRDAIRSHAGAGVRLWFFLQDVPTLEAFYPNKGWGTFMTCAVKQFFGVNDMETARLLSENCGDRTHGYLTTSGSGNVSAQQGDMFGEGGGAGVGVSTSESVSFIQRPLLSPYEAKELLQNWQGDGWRHQVLFASTPHPIRGRLATWDKSPSCAGRVGAFRLSDSETRGA